MALDKKRVEQLALENGFKLKEQEDGSMALNAYVFTFADKLLTEAGGEFAKIIGAGKDTVLLVEAVARIKDLMEGDDGQAWKEARKFLDKLEKPAPAYKCPAPEGQGAEVIENLLRLAQIVDRAVEDWGESFADGSCEVKFHKDEADKMEAILEFFDSLPDAPEDEGVIESGPLKAARALRAAGAAK